MGARTGVAVGAVAAINFAVAPVASQEPNPPEATGTQAPPPEEPPVEDPREGFERGYELYKNGRVREAAEAWERVLALLGPQAGGKLGYNLGLAYHDLGDSTRAVESFERFLAWVAAQTEALPPEFEERRADSAARLKSIKGSHGAIVLPAQTSDIRARIDGGEARRVGFTAYMKPGQHIVEIVGPTGVAKSEALQVRAGVSLMIDTHDPAPPVRPLPVMVRVPVPKLVVEAPEFPTAVVLIGVGLTAVSFALPGGLYRRAAAARADSEELGRGHTDYEEKVAEFGSKRTAYQVSYLLPAVLGTATLGVAIWGVVHVSTGAEHATESSIGVVPAADGGTLWWRLRL